MLTDEEREFVDMIGAQALHLPADDAYHKLLAIISRLTQTPSTASVRDAPMTPHERSAFDSGWNTAWQNGVIDGVTACQKRAKELNGCEGWYMANEFEALKSPAQAGKDTA